MCDHVSDYLGFNLYDVPEFPGHSQFQGGPRGEPDLHGSVQGARAKASPSETRLDSDNDVLFILSRPVPTARRRDPPMVNNTTHNTQVAYQHVTNFDHHNSSGVPKVPAHASILPSHSAEILTEENTAHREHRLLQQILANPRRRKERANVLADLEKIATKLDLESPQALSQISELHKLTQRVASKTETAASELFIRYIRKARRRYAKSVAKAKREDKAPENVLQPRSINLGSAQVSRVVPVDGVPVQERKPLIGKTGGVQDNLQTLHHAINSGATIAQARYATVRKQVQQLSQTLGFDQELELAKFEFLYYRRPDISI